MHAHTRTHLIRKDDRWNEVTRAGNQNSRTQTRSSCAEVFNPHVCAFTAPAHAFSTHARRIHHSRQVLSRVHSLLPPTHSVLTGAGRVRGIADVSRLGVHTDALGAAVLHARGARELVEAPRRLPRRREDADGEAAARARVAQDRDPLLRRAVI